MMVKSVVLPLAPRAAFELFTQKIGEWWPADRRHTEDPTSEIFLLQSGRFYERAGDGREVELGCVRSWELPSRIVLDFFLATGPEKPTEVEITFVAEERGTRVTVTHRPKPVSEALWTERAPRYARSWDVVLAALSRAAA
ncbi:MAG: SRPBCC domain-containing protein [Xanthobacteraceae bacterium]